MIRGLTNAPRGHHGLTPQDAAIMDEWDAGQLTRKQIAQKLGLEPRRVEVTINTYDGRADHAAFRRETRASSERLLAAIARHFPERIAA